MKISNTEEFYVVPACKIHRFDLAIFDTDFSLFCSDRVILKKTSEYGKYREIITDLPIVTKYWFNYGNNTTDPLFLISDSIIFNFDVKRLKNEDILSYEYTDLDVFAYKFTEFYNEAVAQLQKHNQCISDFKASKENQIQKSKMLLKKLENYSKSK